MDKSLVLQLNEVLPYNGQPYFGALELDTIKRGDGSGVAKLSFSLLEATSILIHGGVFYSDSQATVALGTKIDCVQGANNVYVKVSENGKIIFLHAERLEKLGLLNNVRLLTPVGTYSANHPQATINIEKLPRQLSHIDVGDNMTVAYGDAGSLSKLSAPRYIFFRGTASNPSNITGTFKNIQSNNLEIFYVTYTYNNPVVDIATVKPKTMITTHHRLYGCSFKGVLSDFVERAVQIEIPDFESNITGDLSVFKNKTDMTGLVIAHNSVITGSLNDIPATLEAISFNKSEYITYSGGRTWANNFRQLDLSSSPLASDVIDLILIELSSVSWNTTASKIISLKGSRTSASDNAVTSLVNRGVVITFK